MGYHVRTRTTTAIIRPEKYDALRRIIEDNAGEQMYAIAKKGDIHEIIQAFGWQGIFSSEGVYLEFNGRFRSGADMVFPKMIAGVVEDSTDRGEIPYVELEGNCGGTSWDIFRVCFEDGDAVKKNAHISF